MEYAGDVFLVVPAVMCIEMARIDVLAGIIGHNGHGTCSDWDRIV